MKVGQILIIAFLFRLILLFIDNFWFRLPQGGVDTENFDKWAYNISIYGYKDFLETISNGVFLFSSYGAFIYDIFGRKPAVWAFTMLLFGVGTVYNVYKAVLITTKSEKTAALSGWFIALYPNIAILSVLVLRESPIHFFISLAILQLAKYHVTNKINHLIGFFICGLICTILHSGMFALFVGFVIGVIFYNNKMSLGSKLFIILLTLGGLFVINSTGIGLSKFGGSFEGALEKLDEGLSSKESGAKYPDWLILNGGTGDIWKIPIRMIAFLFAPLIPPLVKSPSHLIGVFDAMFYLFFFYFLVKKRNLYKNYKLVGMYTSIIVVLTFAYSLGASNFGTNIRHRAKILPVIVIAGTIAYKYKNKVNGRTKII